MLKEDGGNEQPCFVLYGAFVRMKRRPWQFKLPVAAVRAANTTITLA